MSRIFNFLSILIFIGLYLCLKFLPGLVILSLLTLPATFAYAKFNGRSYNSVVDSDYWVYILNKIGKISIMVIVVWFLTKHFFNLNTFINIF